MVYSCYDSVNHKFPEGSKSYSSERDTVFLESTISAGCVIIESIQQLKSTLVEERIVRITDCNSNVRRSLYKRK